MAHGQRDVVLVVERARHPGDRPARHDFLDEDDPSPPFSRHPGRRAPDVEAQVHLFEVRVARNRDTEHARAPEVKADHAHERPSLPEIELGPGRHEAGENARIDLVVEHHEIAPLCGQEAGGHSGACGSCVMNNPHRAKAQPSSPGLRFQIAQVSAAAKVTQAR